MSKFQKNSRKGLLRLGISAVILLLTFLSVKIMERFGSAFFPGYRHFSKGLMKVLSAIFGILPFSVFDFGAIVLGVLCIVTLLYVLIRKKNILKWLGTMMIVVSCLLCLTICGWMLNHYGPKLSEELGLSVRGFTKEELAEAMEYYYDMAAEYAPLQNRDEEGNLLRNDFYELSEIAGRGYENLSDRNDIFRNGSVKPVKKLIAFSKLLLYQGNTGIFMPITGEANVPEDIAKTDVPFTMCHEAAHRLGLADEEDCNFAAYLSCEASKDVRFLYSGYYMAYVYCSNALLKADRDLCQQILFEKEGEGYSLLRKDADASREHYKQYEGKVQEVGTKVNDTYLKAFSEENGVHSYGMVADDLIAWYFYTHAALGE